MRRRGWLFGLALLIPALWLLQPVYYHLTLPEVELEMSLSGMGCGSHLQITPDASTLRPGQRVRILNQTGMWTIPVRVATTDEAGAPGIVESPPLEPGASWSVTFWKRGHFFVTSAYEPLYWAGIQGWVSVE